MEELIQFVLVLARVGGFFIFAPVFSSYLIPRQVKVGISVALAAVTFPLAGRPPGGLPSDLLGMAILVLSELAIGLAIGYLASLFLAAVQCAGQIVDVMMGFGLVNVMDPTAHRQVTVVGQFELLLGMLIFLGIDGHHWLIEGLARSLQAFPIGSLVMPGALQADIREAFTSAMAIALRLASPVVVSVFLADVALAVLARTVPQMNVFIVGFPLKIGVGFLMLILSLPLFISAVEGSYKVMTRAIFRLFGGVG